MDAAEEDELVISSPQFKNIEDLSPDGRLLIYNTSPGAANSVDLWLLPLVGERNPRPFLNTPFDEDQAVISPDGRWVAYRSDETGRDEIYVSTFPQPGGKWRVSVDGGEDPQWRRDGKELYFTDQDRKLMAAEIKSGSGSFETETPKLLFETELLSEGRNRFVVSGAGNRFLVITQISARAPISVTLNWTAGIKK